MKGGTSKVAVLFAVVTLLTVMVPPDVIVRSAPITVSPSIVADAAVSERWPDDNWGDLDYLRVRSSSVVGELDCRSYIKADLSSIAPGAKVAAASLKLYAFDPPSASRTYLCWRAVGSWNEMSITWNTIPKVDSTIGYDSTSASVGTSAGWVTWDVKNTVQKFLARELATYEPNYGWYVRDQSEGSATTYFTDFRSREYADANYRPRLEIDYYAPALYLDLSASTVAAGNWVRMTVTRKDFDGNLITRGVLYVDLSSTSTSPNRKFSYTAGGATITTVAILNGASSRDFWYYDDKVGTPTIGVSTDDYPNYGGDSEPIQVAPGPPNALDLTPPTATIGAGGQTTFTVTLKDAFGQTTTAPSAVVVTLATTSPQGKFRTVGTTTQITSITVAVGQSFGRFDYYDIQGGTCTITVVSAGLASDTATVTVIPDNNPPTTTLSVGTPKYTSGTTMYVAASTQFTLSPVDAESGVKETKYRVDGGGWTIYSAPFTLAAYSQGSHTIGYMSTDNALNNEAEKTFTVYLDKVPPSVSLVSPSGSVWVTSLSIVFQATVTDPGAGISSVELILDGASQGEMLPGSAYSKTLTVSEGAHAWTVRATDAVGNVEEPSAASATIRLDTTGPSISGVAIAPSSPTHGEVVTVSANVEDPGSGVQTAVLKYSMDGTAWNTAAFNPISGSLYQGTIPGQNAFSTVHYYIEATDRLGNRTTSPSASYSVGIPMLWLIGGGGLLLVLLVLLLLRSFMRPSPTPYPSPPPPT